jgi:adenylate cyclase class 2
MYEVEVKVRADHASVRDRLDDVGAESLDRVRQVDTYYDAPHRDFAATDEALRLREEIGAGDTTIRMTYKGPLVDEHSKTRQEAETTVGDRATMETILGGLGFTPAATVEKDRERYSVEGYVVTLDDVTGLGEFVEVETEIETDAGMMDDDDEPPALTTAREGVNDLLRKLGLDPDAGIRTSYLGLPRDAS